MAQGMISEASDAEQANEGVSEELAPASTGEPTDRQLMENPPAAASPSVPDGPSDAEQAAK